MRSLDVRVAEKVMGLVNVRLYRDPLGRIELVGQTAEDENFVCGAFQPVPEYSTDIAEAWKVHHMVCSKLFSTRAKYFKAMQEHAKFDGKYMAWPDALAALKNTFAEVICLSALYAMEEK